MQEPKQGMPLALMVTLHAIAVFAATMTVYAVCQYIGNPELKVAKLLIGHVSHILTVGILTYLILYMLISRNVVDPLRNLYIKLYAITKGDLRPISSDSRVSEIREIAGGINLMVRMIDEALPDISLEDLSEVIRELRFYAEFAEKIERPERQRFLVLAEKVEKILATLEKKSTQIGRRKI